MRIVEGQPAEDFQMEDTFGTPIALNDYVGKKLLLSFYRYASCPLCNLRIAELIEHYPSFHDKGLYMLAFWESPKESILEYVGRQDVPFPIVADPKRNVYRLYGVESSWLGYIRGMLRLSGFYKALRKGFLPGKMEGEKALLPADFLIGPDLIIKKAYYGKDIGDHLPIEEIEQFLR
jgi:peroxiredoxin Q/BCP